MSAQQTTLQSPLASHIGAFLAHKRALGKRLEKGELILHRLDHHLVAQGVTTLAEVTPERVDAFVRSRPRRCPRSYNGLLGTLRGLFDWLVGQEVFAVSPLLTPSRRVSPPRRPFLFNAAQAKRLIEVAARLPDSPRAPGRGATYRMIFVLLYGLGLRVGEVSRLCRHDVDVERRLLVIRGTKFGKHRLVPMGPRIMQEIDEYLRWQDAQARLITPDTPVFSFGHDRQKPIYPNTISYTFHKLLPELALPVPAGVAPPHLHCLRHSFAVGTLLRWYRAGLDPGARLLYLSTFLGHVSPSSTAVYLTITTELLACASQRFARFAAPVIQECAP